jgi:hypothetical protein
MTRTLTLLLAASVACASDVVLPPLEWAPAPHTYGLEFDLMGLSYHAKRSAGFNEVNPGAGLSLTIGTHDPSDTISADMVASFGSYKDSYSERSVSVIAGPRLTLGRRDGLHTAYACLLGYVSGSGIRGAAIVPILSVGYDEVDLCVTGDPFEDEEESSVVACFLKIRLLDF